MNKTHGKVWGRWPPTPPGSHRGGTYARSWSPKPPYIFFYFGKRIIFPYFGSSGIGNHWQLHENIPSVPDFLGNFFPRLRPKDTLPFPEKMGRGGSSFFSKGGGGGGGLIRFFLLFWCPSRIAASRFFLLFWCPSRVFFAILNPRKWCFPGIY